LFNPLALYQGLHLSVCSGLPLLLEIVPGPQVKKGFFLIGLPLYFPFSHLLPQVLPVATN